MERYPYQIFGVAIGSFPIVLSFGRAVLIAYTIASYILTKRLNHGQSKGYHLDIKLYRVAALCATTLYSFGIAKFRLLESQELTQIFAEQVAIAEILKLSLSRCLFFLVASLHWWRHS